MNSAMNPGGGWLRGGVWGKAGRKPAADNMPIPISAIRLMRGYYIRYRRILQCGSAARGLRQRIQKLHRRAKIAVAFLLILRFPLYVQRPAKTNCFEFLEEPWNADRTMA